MFRRQIGDDPLPKLTEITDSGAIIDHFVLTQWCLVTYIYVG